MARANVVGHLDEVHDIDRSSTTFVDMCMGALNVSHSIPHPLAMQDHIPGLPIHQARQCGFEGCHAIYKTQGSMDTHTRSVHANAAWRNPSVPCVAQQLNRAEAKTYFAVRPLPSPAKDTVEVIVEAVLRETKAKVDGLPQVPVTDRRLVDPWLLGNQWPQIVGNRTPAEVRALVDDPLSIPGIGQDLRALVKECEAILPLTPLLILRRLNTKVPEQ